MHRYRGLTRGNLMVNEKRNVLWAVKCEFPHDLRPIQMLHALVPRYRGHVGQLWSGEAAGEGECSCDGVFRILSSLLVASSLPLLDLLQFQS